MDVANGGQIAAANNVVDFVSGHEIVAAGAHQLRGIGTERLFMLQSSGLDGDSRPLRSRVGPARAVLPTPTQELIGRDDDLKAITKLVREHRAVTLVGPGGIGKTRVAVAAGWELEDSRDSFAYEVEGELDAFAASAEHEHGVGLPGVVLVGVEEPALGEHRADDQHHCKRRQQEAAASRHSSQGAMTRSGSWLGSYMCSYWELIRASPGVATAVSSRAVANRALSRLE